jgi:hypothetical protein
MMVLIRSVREFKHPFYCLKAIINGNGSHADLVAFVGTSAFIA